MNSSSDNQASIDQFNDFRIKYVDSKQIKLDIIITSLRDPTESIREEFIKNLSISNSDFQIDIPMGRARTRDSRNYSSTFLDEKTVSLAIFILQKDPFNII